MSHLNPVLTQKTLLDRAVLNAQTDEEVGYITQVWVDWHLHQVVGFTCSLGFGSQLQRSFRWSQIEAIGLSDLYVSSQQPNPSPFEVSDTIDFRIGHNLYTNTDHCMGRLVDYIVDPNSGAITCYRFSIRRIRQLTDTSYEVRYSLPPKAIRQITAKQMRLHPGATQKVQSIAMGKKIIFPDASPMCS